MSIQNVLIIDDEPDIRELLEITLGRMQLHTRATGTVREAKRLLCAEHFDLCLTDMRLPDGDGIELVEHIQAYYPELPVAVITAHGSMDSAVQALKSGAFDFVSKPVDLKILRDLVGSALKLSRSDGGTPAMKQTVSTRDNLLGDAPVMRQLKGTILKLARSQAPVYILGESGSGKERVAREIHHQGPRVDRPFVPVNCGAIPAELMESEFFGHLKGSFTGAVADKQGLFQASQGGTLFLDEVAELPLHMQVKLLRAIQERAIKPIGAAHEIALDVRILSASHKDLSREVRAGRFRQDLFYRLNVIELRVPPLRERRADLPLLAEHILSRLAEHWGETPRRISPDAMQALMNYDYPGNVRELENILERATTLCESGTIRTEDLQLPVSAGPPTQQPPAPLEQQPLEQHLEHQEKQAILAALEQAGGNRTAAARLLGLSFRQMRYRLKKLGLDS
ncbi:sigma-54-dependent Fis family transcriptional regulator [Ectothiorhodospira shaposhnikovii]|uniref:sigma-54-dependent transcriptional regulator n=1 Tax=Ectothiorhodospira shaposhnikovii TaxID=1054 RepID=UPI0019086633|nr:sigma-54 dependent transcriptional regulator [Ectothiorhodospira shaposhnikovii]MBK1672569.1 sigma-54-dependent Fis family transcriptional regulator [Ectothiorhodospira shaposhnikovii]